MTVEITAAEFTEAIQNLDFEVYSLAWDDESKTLVRDESNELVRRYRPANFAQDGMNGDWLHVMGDDGLRVKGIAFSYEVEGGEGQGDQARGIFHGDNGQVFVVEGWYQSHDGMYLDGELYEAEEFIRQVKDYRPIA